MEATLLLTIIPSFLLIGIFVYSDKFKEPASLVCKVFFLGLAICLPAGWLNGLLIWSQHNPESFTYLAALTEEPLKFLVLYLFLKDKTEFNEPMDAIVYGTTVSLGFATQENFQYVYFVDSSVASYDIAALRSISAIPMHAACGVMMGYFFGKYVFKGLSLMLFASLAIPIFFHAAYNFLASNSLGYAFLLLIIMVLFCDQLHRQSLKEQGTKSLESERKHV